MDETKLEMILEAILFVSKTPVPTTVLAKATSMDIKRVKESLAAMKESFKDRGIVLEEIAGGWQLRTHPDCAETVRRYLQSKPLRLTKQAVETLSIIAYLQPITKAQLEEIRGVDSTGVIKFLMEHGFIRVIGKKEEPGRPFLYGTTRYFLEFFGLPSLSDMPKLREQIDLTPEEMSTLEVEGTAEENGGSRESEELTTTLSILDKPGT